MKDFFIGGPITTFGDKPFNPYPALVSNNFDNFAKEEISNPQMVRRVLKGMVSKEYKHFFIQWDSYNHLVANKNLEIPPGGNFVQDNRWYNECLLICEYCNILEGISKEFKVGITFIDGSLPWTDELLTVDKLKKPNDLSYGMQNILQIDNYNDHEIKDRFTSLQEAVKLINKDLWVCLFNNFDRRARLDIYKMGHPGKESHEWLAEQIKGIHTRFTKVIFRNDAK